MDSLGGLKTHMSRKHKQDEVMSFPLICELCDYEMKDKMDMKKHMIKHSYKTINYQCEECDYCGENKETMAVHVGKEHSETFECGLCDLALQEIETLETHLTTCETYKCNKCSDKFKTLGDIKTHVKDNHSTENGKLHGYYKVTHSKQNRTNNEQIITKSHCIGDLFPDLVNDD